MGIYKRTGCRVIAIEDENGFTNSVDPQRQLTGTERIIVVGSDETTQQFRKQLPVSPVEAAN